MTEQKEFTVTENIKINNPKPKSKKKLVLLISLISCLTIILSIPIVQYITAPKIVENTVAIYLTKKTANFTSFKKTYHTIVFNGTHYIVELSGSANVGYTNNRVRNFYAKVNVSLYTNDISIVKLTFDDYKIVK